MEFKTEQEYRDGVIEAMKAIGTYRDEFLPIVDRLALLYTQRDKLEDQYKRSGSNPVVQHTNKAGATNLAKNPFLTARDETYSQLLAHERELGLTPAALKKMNEGALKITRASSSFADALARALDGAGS